MNRFSIKPQKRESGDGCLFQLINRLVGIYTNKIVDGHFGIPFYPLGKKERGYVKSEHTLLKGWSSRGLYFKAAQITITLISLKPFKP